MMFLVSNIAFGVSRRSPNLFLSCQSTSTPSLFLCHWQRRGFNFCRKFNSFSFTKKVRDPIPPVESRFILYYWLSLATFVAYYGTREISMLNLYVATKTIRSEQEAWSDLQKADLEKSGSAEEEAKAELLKSRSAAEETKTEFLLVQKRLAEQSDEIERLKLTLKEVASKIK